MKLSVFERLSLRNQYLLLAKLYPSEAQHYEQCCKIVEYGYELLYQNLTTAIDEEGVDHDDCREVIDILEMFRMLGNAEKLLPADSPIDREDLKFGGFDGNDEGPQFSLASFLIKDQGRWQESKIDDLNSHGPKLKTYRQMLERWKASEDRHHLTSEDVARIVGPLQPNA